MMYVFHLSLICSSVDGPFGCFHVLAIENRGAVNIGLYVSFWTKDLSRYIPRSGITGWYGTCIFSFLRNIHPYCFPQWPNFHSHQPWRKVLFSPHPLQLLLFVDFLMKAIWLVWGGTSCSFDVHFCNNYWCWAFFFLCLMAIHLSSLEKCLFRSSAHFSIVLLIYLFCYWVIWVVCIFWRLSPWWLHHLQLFSSIL